MASTNTSHQSKLSRWYFRVFFNNQQFSSNLNNSGEHYNSVRPMSPQAIADAARAAPRELQQREPVHVKEYQKEDVKKEKMKPTEDEKKVIKATGCQDIKMIRDMLVENGGMKQEREREREKMNIPFFFLSKILLQGDVMATIKTLSFLINLDSSTL